MHEHTGVRDGEPCAQAAVLRDAVGYPDRIAAQCQRRRVERPGEQRFPVHVQEVSRRGVAHLRAALHQQHRRAAIEKTDVGGTPVRASAARHEHEALAVGQELRPPVRVLLARPVERGDLGGRPAACRDPEQPVAQRHDHGVVAVPGGPDEGVLHGDDGPRAAAGALDSEQAAIGDEAKRAAVTGPERQFGAVGAVHPPDRSGRQVVDVDAGAPPARGRATNASWLPSGDTSGGIEPLVSRSAGAMLNRTAGASAGRAPAMSALGRQAAQGPRRGRAPAAIASPPSARRLRRW